MNWAEKLANKCVEGLRIAWDFLNTPVPRWLIEMCTKIGELVFSLLKAAGQVYIIKIEEMIIETKDKYPNASDEEKFKIIFDFAKVLLPMWKDSKIDTLIQNLFIKLKDSKMV